MGILNFQCVWTKECVLGLFRPVRQGGETIRVRNSVSVNHIQLQLLTMIKSIRFALIMILVGGCIETYQFRITDTHPGIVVEATISNKSFNDTRNYPSDGRYFTVKVTRTSDVTNIRSEAVSYAQVVLTSDQGDEWLYTEDVKTPGLYQLR